MSQQLLANKALHWRLWCLSLHRPQKGQRLPSPPLLSCSASCAWWPDFLHFMNKPVLSDPSTGSEDGSWWVDSWCWKSPLSREPGKWQQCVGFPGWAERTAQQGFLPWGVEGGRYAFSKPVFFSWLYYPLTMCLLNFSGHPPFFWL